MKQVILVVVLLAVALAGCSRPSQAVSAENRAIYREEGSEVCYDGVVYVRFTATNNVNSSWGSVKINKYTGLPVTCN